MAKPRPAPDLDPHTARLARDWFAEARARTAAEAAETRRGRPRDTSEEAPEGLWDWLFAEADADDGGDADGA